MMNSFKTMLLSVTALCGLTATAQETFVLVGNASDSETKLNINYEVAAAAAGTFSCTDYREGDAVVGFTQTFSGAGNWALNYYRLSGKGVNPAILATNDYKLEYEARTTWSGDIKFKFESTPGVIEKNITLTRDGEWHNVTLDLKEFAGESILSNLTSESSLVFGFVIGGWNVSEATTIDVRNVKLMPIVAVEDTQAPTWSAEPSISNITASKATVSVSATDDISSKVFYEAATDESFTDIIATVTGQSGNTTDINLTGLTKNTSYTIYLRAKDSTGNVAAETKTVTFTTADASPLAGNTYHGIAKASDGTYKYLPKIYYDITYNDDATLTINAELSQWYINIETIQLCINGEYMTLTQNGSKTKYSITTTKTFEEEQVITDIFFYLPYPLGASRADFDYTAGSKNEAPADNTTVAVWDEIPTVTTTSSSATISVKATNADGGDIVYQLTKGDNFENVFLAVKAASGAASSLEINDLEAATQYTMKVRTVNHENNAGEEQVVTFTTLGDVADTTAPVWNAEPTTGVVTYNSAEIIVNITDDSGKANVTITSDEMSTVTQTIVADGTNQVIKLEGLSAETTYVLNFSVKDEAGNVGDTKQYVLITPPSGESVLYQRIEITKTMWNNNNPFNLDGSLLITINADNTLTFRLETKSTTEGFAERNLYIHDIEDGVSMTEVKTGVYEYTTSKTITDRTATIPFHMYFVKETQVSTLDVIFFTPINGSTSATEMIESDKVKVVAAKGSIRVSGAEGQTVSIFSTSGALMYQAVASGEQTISLHSGVYIVVVAGKAYKVIY